jgi:hypothetical protein
MTDTFDISTIEVSDTFDVEIIDTRSGDPMIHNGKVLSVTVYGPASAKFKAAQAVANAKAMKRFRSKGKADKTAEEEAADTASFLSAITASLNNFNYKQQTEGREVFRALYTDPKMGFITEQVNTAAGDWANFTTASSTS